jgi:predicted RNA-binding protein with PUA-like domain
MPSARRYWLVKSEPESFSIDDLAASPKQTTCWDGVRNYQARNFMKAMKRGERVLFYHSSTEPMAIVGTATVAREAYPDPTAWDAKNDHFDPKASPENPIWEMVDLKLDEIFPEPITLAALRAVPALAKMELLRKGSRLSVQPVTEKEFEMVVKVAHAARAKQSDPKSRTAAGRRR